MHACMRMAMVTVCCDESRQLFCCDEMLLPHSMRDSTLLQIGTHAYAVSLLVVCCAESLLKVCCAVTNKWQCDETTASVVVLSTYAVL